MPYKDEDKIKPYTVIDLSTHTVLSPDEIDDCLKEATEKQRLKLIGHYAYNGNHAKLNGDAPNFIAVPPKKRSQSLGSLYDVVKKTDPNVFEGALVEPPPSEYDVVSFRERSYTAPATCKDVITSRRRKASKELIKSIKKIRSIRIRAIGIKAATEGGHACIEVTVKNQFYWEQAHDQFYSFVV